MRRYILIAISTLLAGCATMSDRNQRVIVTTSTPGIEVEEGGQKLGTTPVIINIKRAKIAELKFVSANGLTQTTQIKGHYRWGKSFGANLIWFIYFAPIGWITDATTGAAWSYPNELDINLPKGFRGIRQRKSSHPYTLAVAPPISNHPNISDEVGRWMTKKLDAEHLRYQIIPYDKSLNAFRDNDVDYDHSDRDGMITAYYKLNSRRILVSTVHNDEDKIRVDAQTKDAFDSSYNQRFHFEIPKSDMPAVQDIGLVSSYSNPLYWLPNSIGIGLVQTNSEFTLNGQDIKSSTYNNDTLGSAIYQVVSSVSVRHIFQPYDRSGWHYRWSFSPTLTFSYANEKFAGVPALEDANFVRTHVDAGYGPNFFFENRKWSLYADIFGIVEYDDISALTATNKFDVNATEISTAVELGVMYFFNSHWFVRAYSESANLPEDLWNEAFNRVENQSVVLTDASLITTGIGVSYVFSSKDLKFWAH